MPAIARLHRLHPLFKHVFAGLLLGALTTQFAFADEYSDVNRLVRAGQVAEALNKAEQFLTAKPRDPQMRFLKGVILTETGKSNEAIATFVKLTEEFPELPEPYNNLAVLYASQNQFDKARSALEMAIRTNPSYATAHENLGDVYAKLASQAYSKALQLDGTNAGVPPKLALIRNLFSPDARSGRPGTAQSPAASQQAVTPATSSVKQPPSAVTPVAATAAPTPQAAKPAAAASSGSEQEVISSVEAWAKAWASKDMPDYLGAYDPKFVPPGKKSRKEWETERRDRIVSKSTISVEVTEFDVKVNDATAIASFRQNYKAGALTANSRKTLELSKKSGRWLITKESTGG